MKITDILIEQFGRWNDLLLPVRKKGISLIHGPNEAGKSTLLRFIRGVLYGYPAAGLITSHGGDRTTGWGGSLRVKHHGEHYELTRRIEENGRQAFRVSHKNHALTPQQYEKKILQQVNADVYRTIYTLGLKELRELATLQSEHIGEYIYGTSLGAVGQQLLSSSNQTRQFSNALVDEKHDQGKLFDLSGQYNSLQQALSRADNVLTQYELSLEEQKKLEKKQVERKHRLEQLQREQGNYRFLSRIWKPWKRHRELTAQYNRLNALSGFPDDGLRKLETLEQKIAKISRRQKALLEERSKVKQLLQAERKSYELRDHASGVRALIDLKTMVETAERHLGDVTADAAMLKSELDQKLNSADSSWTLDKLDQIDTSPQAHLKLVTAARDYQNSLRRRARYRRRYQKLADGNHNRQLELQEQFKKQNITSIDQAVQKANQRIRDLEKLTKLRIQETEFDQRIRSAQSQIIKLQEGAELPWWASLMLTIFFMAGGFFVVAGLFKTVQTSWLVGAIYMLTGIMGTGLAWAMRLHYEQNDTELQYKLNEEIDQCQFDLEKTQNQIAQITGVSSKHKLLSADLQSPRKNLTEAELIRQATQKLTELEQFARDEEKIKRIRKKLSVRRGKLGDYQREASAARQSWCDLLKTLGLRETIRTAEAFEDWQQADDLKQTLIRWNAAKEDVQRHTEILSLFKEQMEQISRRMQLEDQPHRSVTQTLSHWESLLNDYERVKDSYHQRKKEYLDLKNELETNREELQLEKQNLQALLKQGHAETREQFRANARQLHKVHELRNQLDELNDQLATLAQEEPELAIVEEDLLQFQPQQTQERIEMIGLEIEEIQHDLEQSHQQLGRIRQSQAALESDNTLANLKTRQARLLDRAQITLRDWQASQRATTAFSEMTEQLERDYQPETLARASHYLLKLTCGRYEQVRTPFGSRELLIYEKDGSVRKITELSDGTREQLLLALRMALIDLFAKQGIELPIVLDDICVNFDQVRTEAAVKTLIEFAQNKQVLFFTCHNHLATLFEKQGVEPTWLPKFHTPEKQLLAG